MITMSGPEPPASGRVSLDAFQHASAFYHIPLFYMVSVHRNGRDNGIERRNDQFERVTVRLDQDRTAVSDVVGDLQDSLTRLLRADDDEVARVELTRIADIRHAMVATLRTLLALDERLARSELVVQEVRDLLKNQQPQKDWYSVAELAALLGKAEFTVREWCRLGRVTASKRQCGRGSSQEWMVSHEELTRIQSYGLLPD
jgi:ADP-ribose pyrophosphatase YjhB (NUDIX family)